MYDTGEIIVDMDNNNIENFDALLYKYSQI